MGGGGGVHKGLEKEDGNALGVSSGVGTCWISVAAAKETCGCARRPTQSVGSVLRTAGPQQRTTMVQRVMAAAEVAEGGLWGPGVNARTREQDERGTRTLGKG